MDQSDADDVVICSRWTIGLDTKSPGVDCRTFSTIDSCGPVFHYRRVTNDPLCDPLPGSTTRSSDWSPPR
eukprot:3393930-Pyramimonas_sp.AAC.1